MDFVNRVAIVTGGVGSIGKAICMVLAQAGMKVVVADIDTKACEEYSLELSCQGFEAIGVEVDVSSAKSTEKLVAEVVDKFGSIDVLVNNAGIIRLGSLTELEEDVWDSVVDVNLKGSFLCAKAVAPFMINQRSGRIINFASVAAARPAPLQSAYAAAKSGILGLSRVWCQELAQYDITVNTICPGFINSAMWDDHLGPAYVEQVGGESGDVIDVLSKANMPLGRSQDANDIAEAVAYLVSAKNVTGHSLYVDGGFTMV